MLFVIISESITEFRDKNIDFKILFMQYQSAEMGKGSSILEEIFQEASIPCTNPNCQCAACRSRRDNVNNSSLQQIRELGFELTGEEEYELSKAFDKIKNLAKRTYHRARPFIVTADIIRRLISPATDPIPQMKDVASYVEQNKRRQTQERIERAQLAAKGNVTQKPPDGEMSLLQEVFMEEEFPEKELLILEISVPGKQFEFGFDRELDDIGKRIEKCLAMSPPIPGIKKNSVKRGKDAEIIMELDYLITPQVTINRRRGNTYRDAIGAALEKCNNLFASVNVEGAAGVNNRRVTGQGVRYVDINLIDKKTNKPVNIEIKRGKSRYHRSQRKKDAALAARGKGTTYVVRGTAKRKGREINY